MSGTTTGADPADAATPPPESVDEAVTDAADLDAAGSDAADAIETPSDDAEAVVNDAAVTDPGADPAEQELGFAVPTWYVLFCALPFAAAFLVPITVIYRAQNSVPPMSAASAAWLGVATGWVLWLIGAAGWLLGPVVLAGARRRAPVAWEWWHRTTRAWVVVVLAWGLVASLSVVAVAFLLGRLSA
jgi:hypothetical protein